MLITFFTTAFITTTFLLQWWIRPSYPTALWLFLGFVGSLGFVGCFWYQRSLAVRVASLLLSCTLGIALALWNIARTERTLRETLAHLPFDTTLHVEGMVTGIPTLKEGGFTYTLALRTVASQQTPLPIRGNITVRTRDTIARFTHGDIVGVEGTLEPIPPPYDTYFRSHKVLGGISYARVEGTGRREGSSILRLLAQWNARVALRIRDLVPEPEATLLIGLLLGDTGGFSRETLEAFRTAGLAHILAVSGYNVTLLLIAVSILVTRLPSLLRLLTACIAVTLFTLFVGASPSAIRAALMGSLGLLALHTRHLPDTRRAILFAAFLMLLWNPMQLWWDASFQLSFLAVIGIAELQPIFKRLFQNLPPHFAIRETLTVTLATQCAALPWAAALFGNIPLLSPLTNVLVAPIIPFVMVAGPIALLGGMLSDLLGRLLAFPCWVALQWIVRIAETTALVPLASIPFPKNTYFPLVLYASALLIFLARHRCRMNSSLPTVQEELRIPPPRRN